MQKKWLMTVAAIMVTMTVCAQQVDETQGAGGLVLDSLYTTGSNGLRSMKYVYEYSEVKLPVLRQELAYFDEVGHSIDEPRLTGYEANIYDDQNRLLKQESYAETDGEFRLSTIEEIAEYDAATGLPAVVYAYQVDVDDPDATPQLVQKAVTTKYHGDIGLEDVEVYIMMGDEWMLMGTLHNDYDAAGLLLQEVMSFGSMQIVTDFEYDDHGQITRKVVKEQMDNYGEIMEISSVEMNFTNDYYDDGNLKTSAEYDDGTYIETSYYFWGNGVTTAIGQMASALEMADKYFDLSGHRLSGKPSLKGLYIHQGKKIIRK